MLSTTMFPLPSIWQTDLAVPLSSTDPVVESPYHAEVATGSVGCTGGAGGGGEGVASVLTPPSASGNVSRRAPRRPTWCAPGHRPARSHANSPGGRRRCHPRSAQPRAEAAALWRIGCWHRMQSQLCWKEAGGVGSGFGLYSDGSPSSRALPSAAGSVGGCASLKARRRHRRWAPWPGRPSRARASASGRGRLRESRVERAWASPSSACSRFRGRSCGRLL